MPRAPKVWLIKRPESSSVSQNQTDVERIAVSRGWSVFRTECVRLAVTKGDGTGRSSNFLTRVDAHRLYEDMHRGPVAVLFEAQTWVRTSPEAGAARKRMVPIDQFCRYKTFTANLADSGASDWGAGFDSWLGTTDCDGTGDPRVLPFHIFAMREAKDPPLDLDISEGRKRFELLHSQDQGLIDDSERRWQAGAAHGRDPQFVRNVELPLGFHWDVRKRNGTKIETPMVVWKVAGHGYINVYADGHVRRGSHDCKQVWDEQHSKSDDEAERRRSRQKL